jgi:hypothetical protein
MTGKDNVEENTDSYANVFISVLSGHGDTVVKVVWRHRRCLL